MKASISAEDSSAAWLPVVQQQIATLRFGVVQIIVHDGRVVQIERTEKVRMDQMESSTLKPAYQTPGSQNRFNHPGH
jgi:hypothetical protein